MRGTSGEFLQELRARVRSGKRRLVLPEGTDIVSVACITAEMVKEAE